MFFCTLTNLVKCGIIITPSRRSLHKIILSHTVAERKQTMKKSRIFAMLSLLLCFVMVAVSCGSSVGEYFNADFEESKLLTLSNQTPFSDTKDYTLAPNTEKGNLIVFTKTEDTRKTQTVYNIATGASVCTVQETDTGDTSYTVELYSTGDDAADYFIVTTTVKNEGVTSDKLYDANGKVLVDYNYDVGRSDVGYTAFIFGDALYSYDDKDIVVKVGDIDEFSNVGSFSRGYDNNYIEHINYSGITDYIKVTDKVGNYISTFKLKTQYNLIDWDILANGDIYAQYQEKLPDDTNKYDFSQNGEKYNLITEIYSVKKNKVKEVDIDFVISGISNNNPDIFAADFDDNLGLITYIEDKKIDSTTTECVILDNRLDVKESMNDLVEGFNYATLIGDNRYVITDFSGNKHFMLDGEVYKTVTGTVTYNEKYIYTDNAIYDLDFKKVCDLRAGEYDREFIGDASVLVKKAEEIEGVEYYTYTLLNSSGASVDIAKDIKADAANNIEGRKNSVTMFGKNLYKVTYSKNSDSGVVQCNEIYNEKGTLITTFNSTPVSVATARNGAVLLYVYDSVTDITDYYRIG